MQDDELSPDWQNWTFLDKSVVNNGHTLQNTCSSVFEGCVKSLSVDDLPNVLPASGAIVEPMDHGFAKQECIKELTSTVYNVDADEEMIIRHVLSTAEVVNFILHSCVTFLLSLLSKVELVSTSQVVTTSA